jgi:hypothetical protein
MPANNGFSSNEEVNMNEVLLTINEFANNVYQKFADIDERFNVLEKRAEKIEAQMVTKYYLDEKLADLRFQLEEKIEKTDKCLNGLIITLENKQIIALS